MSKTATYDPSQVTMTWGPYTIQGVMDGTFVDAERDEDAVTKKTGSQGDTARVKNKNRGGSVTFTLMHTSPSNDDLSAAAILDEQSNPGVVYPLTVKDLNGTTNVFAAEAWIKKTAKFERAKDLSPTVWILDCADMKPLIGGNQV